MHIAHLIWDSFNITHIAKHNVTQEEVEEACQDQIGELDAKFGRILLIGKTKADRFLTICLDPEDNNEYYPVTARDASRKERQLIKEKEVTTTNDR